MSTDKRKKMRTDRPGPAYALRSYKDAMGEIVSELEYAELEIRRIVGIARGLTNVSSLDELKHRVKSLYGHRKASAKATAIMTRFRAIVQTWEEELE